MAAPDCLLVNARFVLPRSILEGGAVAIREGRIRAILEAGDRLPPDLPRRDLGGALVSPGLVELHLHGVDGLRFDSLGSDRVRAREELLAMRDALRSRGVTCFVPTLICREASIATLAQAIEDAALPDSELPGMYLEGPFLSSRQAGRIPPDALRAPDSRLLGDLINLARGRLRCMTVAPELPGAREIMARLSAVGALPCLGHSDCSLDQVRLPDGKFSLTHLFNSMSPFSHETQGLAMLPFLDHRPFVELIADGLRVNEAALRICAAAIDPEKLMLVSDAGTSLPPSPGESSGAAAVGVELLRKWLALSGSSLPNAVRMLSLTPAHALDLETRRGAIAPGLEADLVVWNGDFESVREIL